MLNHVFFRFKGCRPCRRPRKNWQGSKPNWQKTFRCFAPWGFRPFSYVYILLWNIFDRFELLFVNGFFIWVYVNIMILWFYGFMDLSNSIIVIYYIRYFWPYYYIASVAPHRCMVAPHRCMIFYQSIRGPCFFDPPPCFFDHPRVCLTPHEWNLKWNSKEIFKKPTWMFENLDNKEILHKTLNLTLNETWKNP